MRANSPPALPWLLQVSHVSPTAEMFIRIAAMGLSTDAKGRPSRLTAAMRAAANQRRGACSPTMCSSRDETVVVCNPDPMDRHHDLEQKDRVALRVKIMDSSNSERRGWISAEEQVYSSRSTRSRATPRQRSRKLHTINGVPILPTEEEDRTHGRHVRQGRAAQEAGQHVRRPEGREGEEESPAQAEYADLVVIGALRADPLRFRAMLFKASGFHDHVGDVQRQSEKFAPGRSSRSPAGTARHPRLFRGEETEPGVANNVPEVGEGLGYAKGTPSSPADGNTCCGCRAGLKLDALRREELGAADGRESGHEPHAQPNRDGEAN